jgi:para-aminobenzoate synthetase component 1
MGGRLASDLQEISNDPTCLDEGGFWAVSTTFEGEWTCARFGKVENAEFPYTSEKWRGSQGPWESTQSQEEYMNYVDEIRRLISLGTVYQVNACREISAPMKGDSLHALMQDLIHHNPAPHASYLRIPDIEIASASPELFFQLKNGVVTSAPIKGTKSPEFDGIDFGKKDVAENIMIVDLIRNDIGKICQTGTVSVPKLLATESHPGLSHLVSYVKGRIEKGIGWNEISDAMMPPGSVSGAPKSSAVRIIADYENRARGPYCGALGWVENGEALLSLGIRIFWNNRDGVLRFGTGAGITWGSDAEQEWEETELKARRLLSIAEGNFS